MQILKLAWRTFYDPGQFQKDLYGIIVAKRYLFLTTNFLQPAEFRRMNTELSSDWVGHGRHVNVCFGAPQIFQYSYANFWLILGVRTC